MSLLLSLEAHSFLAMAPSDWSGHTQPDVSSWFCKNSDCKYGLLTSPQPNFSSHHDSSVSGQRGKSVGEPAKWSCVAVCSISAEKWTEAKIRSLPELLGGESEGSLRENTKYTTCCHWLDYCFFINSIGSPLPACFFFPTSCSSCCCRCCFHLPSTLLFLLPVAVVLSDEAPLQRCDTSQTFMLHSRGPRWPFAAHTVTETAHWLNYPATSFLKKKREGSVIARPARVHRSRNMFACIRHFNENRQFSSGAEGGEERGASGLFSGTDTGR